MLGPNGLPLNEYLYQLPPLPETPKRSKEMEENLERAAYTSIPRNFSSIQKINSATVAQTEYKNEKGLKSQDLETNHSMEDTTYTLNSFPAMSTTGCQVRLAKGNGTNAIQVEQSPSYRSSPINPPVPVRRLSASFRLAHMGDISLIGDCSIFGGAASSVGDDSLEYELSNLRSRSSDLDNPRTWDDGKKEKVETKTKTNLNKSSLLPQSPAKHAHLLQSTNNLHSMQPPWSGNDSVMTTAFDDSDDTVIGFEPSRLDQTLPYKTLSDPQASQIVAPVHTQFERTLPLFPSRDSLVAVGREAERSNLDMSTLFPVSPQKATHLLCDDEMILRETLEEISSGFAMPPQNQQKEKEIFVSDADMTMDVRDMMANMRTFKRMSDTEESFVDLLHEKDNDLVRMDMTLLGPDETVILPAGLKSLNDTLHERKLIEGQSAPMSRLKSISRVTEIIQRVKADKMASQTNKRATVAQTPKTVSTARTYRTSATSVVTPVVSKPRLATAPHTTKPGGTLPSIRPTTTISSASLKSIELLASRIAHSETTRTYSFESDPSFKPLLSGRTTEGMLQKTNGNQSTTACRRNDPFATQVLQKSIAPTGREEAKARTGLLVSTMAVATPLTRTPSAKNSVTSARALPRLSVHTGIPAVARLPRAPATSTSISLSVGLPKPGNGTSARSAPTATTSTSAFSKPRISRAFGRNAISATNKLERLPAVTPNNKKSADPSSVICTTMTTSDQLRIRALSTPASTVVHQSFIPSSRSIADTAKRTLTKLNGEAQKTRVGSNLPRSSISRLPVVEGKKSSAPPTPIGKNLASLRMRLDELQARQQSRVARNVN
ncbi:uncharacterized protein L203_103661 [Cryptococcus depauperatus CBS 7841]|uniref:Uncharacterized protein n=1 Tax=Cryptococcus depauperatus CBS 7841 TaxID=1295531 RepID=A0A1E3IF64_9TREE|nr:hypothetical protein L203_03839 [Cryptococcus depauperatus CBS 7841]